MALTPRHVLTWSWAAGVSYTATRLEGTIHFQLTSLQQATTKGAVASAARFTG